MQHFLRCYNNCQQNFPTEFFSRICINRKYNPSSISSNFVHKERPLLRINFLLSFVPCLAKEGEIICQICFAGKKKADRHRYLNSFGARNNALHRVNSCILALDANPNVGIPFPRWRTSVDLADFTRDRYPRNASGGFQAAITQQLKSSRHARISVVRTRDWYKWRPWCDKKIDFPREPFSSTFPAINPGRISKLWNKRRDSLIK